MRTVRIQQVEDWVMRVADVVLRGEKTEDARVELKGDWPDPKDAARRIAGACNAARGEPVPFIIGLREGAGVTTRRTVDLADWIAGVRREFDEDVWPTMTDAVVTVEPGETVHALQFDSDRSPYVIKNPTGQGSSNERFPGGTGRPSERRVGPTSFASSCR